MHFLTFIEVNVSLDPFLIVVVKHFFVKSYPFVFVVFPVLIFLFILSFYDLTCWTLLIGLYLLRTLIYIRWMIKDWAYWIRLWVVIVVHIWVTLFLIFFWISLSRIAKQIHLLFNQLSIILWIFDILNPILLLSFLKRR